MIEHLLEPVRELLTGSTDPVHAAWLIGFSILLGATHTFGPGHGKSLLLGVLVADSRRLGHALKMAAVIGITHMADVIAMSLLSIVLVASLPAGSLSTLLGWVSGLGLLGVGAYRVVREIARSDDGHRDHDHAHSHDHEDHASSSQTSPRERERQNLLSAFLYSLAPCPGAWVLFMTCVGLGRPVYGVLLLAGFTLGLLATIALIALSIVYSLIQMESWIPSWGNRALSVASGAFILALGGWILFQTTVGGLHVPVGESVDHLTH